MAKRNPLSESEKRLNNLARLFESKRAKGESVFMDVDDFADLCSWYDNNYNAEKGDEVMRYALDVYPESSMLHIEQAYRLLDKGDIEGAKLLTQEIEDDLTGDLQILKARLLIEQGHYEEADDLLNSQPGDLLDPILVANMYIDTHFSNKALDWVQQHGKGLEDEEEYLCVLVNGYCYTKRYQEAIQICEKLIDRDPFSAHYWLTLGRCQLALGEYHHALDACDFAVTNDEDLGEAYLTRCNLYALLGNEERAKKDLQQAIRLKAVVPGDMNELDLGLLLEEGRCEEALKLMKFYLKYMDLTEEQVLNIYYRMGMCYTDIGWYQAAHDCFNKVLDASPQDADTMVKKALVYLEELKPDEAQKILLLAAKAAPEWKNLYKMIAVISLYMGHYDDFRHYGELSGDPLPEEKIKEVIRLIEEGKSYSIDDLKDIMKDDSSK